MASPGLILSTQLGGQCSAQDGVCEKGALPGSQGSLSLSSEPHTGYDGTQPRIPATLVWPWVGLSLQTGPSRVSSLGIGLGAI